ncbi:nucleoporin Nup133p [Monosporozyma unispora]|nr:hypothetical protein C6P44_003934 [Kazachstania unispora]
MSNVGTKKPVFQLRKEVASLVQNSTESSEINNISDAEVDSTLNQTSFVSMTSNNNEETNPITLLTENEKYIVKSLKIDLLSLVKDTNVTGSIDSFSGKAMINDHDQLYIWNYNDSIVQKHSPFNKIPLDHIQGDGKDMLPICLLTWPATMDQSGQETNLGICIIHRQSGKFVFYEDISSINNLYSQLSQNLAHVLDLGLANSSEYITSAISVEPSGVVLATSFGRVLFVTIRDSMGKPKVQLKQQLIKSQKNFFSNLFAGKVNDNTIQHHDIVSLKNGPIVGKGDRLLYITTRKGEFQIWQLSVTSNCYKRIELNFYNQIMESLKDLYPFALSSLQILDSHPIFNDDHLTHMILSSITNGKDETCYILSTLIFDEKSNNFIIFSTYRLNTYSSPPEYTSSTIKFPKLMIPNALNNKDEQNNVINVIVLFHNAMVLTQISPKLDISFTLKRKWEDIISFRDSMDILGLGYTNDKVYLLSKDIGGVLSIGLKDIDKLENESLDEETRFVKTHIDQAIYFAKDADFENMSPIEFNLSKEIFLDMKTIENDLKLSASEIIHSTGKYITSSVSEDKNLPQHLLTRINYFKNLINFTELNFNDKISYTLKLWLVENFEIMNSCLKIYQFLDTPDNNNNEKLQIVWNNVLKQNNLTNTKLIISHIDQYPKVFNEFLQNITINTESIEFKSNLINLINSSIYKAVLEDGEKNLRYGKLNLDTRQLDKDHLPWFINLSNLKQLNDIFFQYKFQFNDEKRTIESDEIKEQILTLLKTLYYCFNQVRLWATQVASTLGDVKSQEIIEINKLYTENHIDWNHVLCEISYQTQSIEITEFYKDLEALVQTLETLPAEDIDVINLYQEFFDKFQMLFASTLFEYYANNNKLPELFYRFPQQHDQLIQFFQDNSDKYGAISWIQDIIDGRYSDASKILSTLPLLNQDIDTNQLHLNVAKLTCLVEEPDNVNMKQLQQIQCNLDLLDGEIEFINKLKQNEIELSERYVGTSMELIFNQLTNLLNENKTVSFNEIIEMYSVLTDGDSIYCALKLLSFNIELIEFEIKKYLISTLWKRCILLDLDQQKSDGAIENTILYGILERFFHERLYEHDYPLPHFSLLTDNSIISDELLRNLYGKYVNDDIEGIKNMMDSETETISRQLNFARLQDIISTANASTGNQCVINYETNEIEYTKE